MEILVTAGRLSGVLVCRIEAAGEFSLATMAVIISWALCRVSDGSGQAKGSMLMTRL